jgi:transcriptional regulator with XRE-family HTH domain
VGDSRQPQKVGWQGDLIALCGLLARKRKQEGLTQKALAEHLGITERHLRRIENGEQDASTVPAALLFEWAEVVGIRVFDPTPYLGKPDHD